MAGQKRVWGQTPNDVQNDKLASSYFSFVLVAAITDDNNPAAGLPGVVTYTYDPAGNRLQQTRDDEVTDYQYNEANQMLSAGETQYGYDANGNRVNKSEGRRLGLVQVSDLNQQGLPPLPMGATPSLPPRSGMQKKPDRLTTAHNAYVLQL